MLSRNQFTGAFFSCLLVQSSFFKDRIYLAPVYDIICFIVSTFTHMHQFHLITRTLDLLLSGFYVLFCILLVIVQLNLSSSDLFNDEITAINAQCGDICLVHW